MFYVVELGNLLASLCKLSVQLHKKHNLHRKIHPFKVPDSVGETLEPIHVNSAYVTMLKYSSVSSKFVYLAQNVLMCQMILQFEHC